MKNKTIQSKKAIFNIQRCSHSHGIQLPSYATPLSAGMDLYAAIPKNEPVVLAPSSRCLIPSGVCISLPEGYEAQIRPRSGIAWKYGVTVINSPGTIDADYRGEIKIALINLGKEDFTIKRGMRIAQIVISPYESISWNLCDSLEETDRGEGGFGSSGVV